MFAILSNGAVAPSAEPPTIPLLPMAAIDAEDPYGLSIRCHLGMQGATSDLASFGADDCGVGRAQEPRLIPTAVSANIHATREIFHTLTSSRSS